MVMKLIGLLLSLLSVVGLFWFAAIWANKKGLLNDEDNDHIPDIIEDVIEEKKEEVKKKVTRAKKKVKEVKDVINKK